MRKRGLLILLSFSLLVVFSSGCDEDKTKKNDEKLHPAESTELVTKPTGSTELLTRSAEKVGFRVDEIKVIHEKKEDTEVKTEKNAIDKYSSVFLTSRWWRVAGKDGQAGTLDMLKRFMATGDKWTYLNAPDTDPKAVENITNLGVSFQATVNADLGKNQIDMSNKDIEGNYIMANWVKAPSVIPWGDITNPAYYDYIRDWGYAGIDKGAASFQYDDWGLNSRACPWGGGFSEMSLNSFTKWLKENYSASELLKMGIANIEHFKYKTFLKDQGITTREQYMNQVTGHKSLQINNTPLSADKRICQSLYAAFKQFNMEMTWDFHTNLKNDWEAYAQRKLGRSITYSGNLGLGDGINTETHFIADVFDFIVGETDEPYDIETFVTWGSVSTGMGTSSAFMPRPITVKAFKKALPLVYAMGHYFIIPWDAFLPDNKPRFFGTVEDFGDQYHFIREYPFLFDGYEIPARVGILVRLDELGGRNSQNSKTLLKTTMDLFYGGVPFTILAANEAYPAIQMDTDKINELDYLVACSPVSSFEPKVREIIQDCGIPVISPDEINLEFYKKNKAVTATSANQIDAVMRKKPDNREAPIVIHLVNTHDNDAEDITVSIDDSFLHENGTFSAKLYRPAEDPQVLEIAACDDGTHKVVIPELKDWGILAIIRNNVSFVEEYVLPEAYSGIAIGNPAECGQASVNTDDSIHVKSKGIGLNAAFLEDPGSSDQITLVYRNVRNEPGQDISIEAQIVSQSGEEGSMAGVMLRETPASNARFVAVVYEKGEGLKMITRHNYDEHTFSMELGEVNLPVYVKVQKKSDAYYAYLSADGRSWGEPIGRQIILEKVNGMAMETLKGGVFVSSATNTADNTGVFSQIKVIGANEE